MIEIIGYLCGLGGVWLVCDCLISIRLYLNQSWRYDHSIRVLRGCWGLALILFGWLLIKGG